MATCPCDVVEEAITIPSGLSLISSFTFSAIGIRRPFMHDFAFSLSNSHIPTKLISLLFIEFLIWIEPIPPAPIIPSPVSYTHLTLPTNREV